MSMADYLDKKDDEGFNGLPMTQTCTMPRDMRPVSVETLTRAMQEIDLLAMMFDAYEDGPDCYEDPEDCSGHIGKAIHLDDEAFQRIADILNEHRPRNTAVSPAPTFADGMTAEDDRRFLEATSGLDSYELPRCFRCGHLLHAGDCVNVAPYNA